MAALDSFTDISDSRLNHKRFIALAGSLVVVLIATTFFSGSGSQANTDKTKLKAQRASMLSEPNPVKNPPYTFGPKCAMNVAVALDRSGSAMPYEDQLKGTLKQFYDLLHSRANSIPTGGSANILLDAFGTYSVPQNSPPPNPTEAQIWEWFDRINIADADNLEFQKNIVDDIYYVGDQNQPYPPGRPDLAYKGFFGGLYSDFTPFRKSAAGAGATNYDAPLTSLMRQITFWTWGEPERRGDDDFDLVVLITDGMPNRSYGPDHQPQFREPDLLNTSDPSNSLKYAREAVNTLRTGNAVKNEETDEEVGDQYTKARPPVPVIGILAGMGEDREESAINMSYVFGENSWYITSDFTKELSAALAKAIEGVGCFPVDEVVVNPDFKVEAVPASQTAEEGVDTFAKLKITNTGPTQMDIQNIKVYGPFDTATPANRGTPRVIPVNETLTVNGEGKSITRPVEVEGKPESTVYYIYEVVGKGIIDPATEQCTPGGESDPCVRVRETFSTISTKAKRFPS